MKLIVEYAVSDDCTYSYLATEAVEYESAEVFAVEFEQLCLEAWNQRRSANIQFAGVHWDTDVFFGEYNPETKSRPYQAPAVYTVDEWFASRGAK